MIIKKLEQNPNPDPEPEPGPSRQKVEPVQLGCHKFLLNHFKDFMPSSYTAVPHVPKPVWDPTPSASTHSSSPSPLVHTPEPVLSRTECDNFGLYCEYLTLPTTSPEADQDLDNIYDIPGKPLMESGQHWWTGVGAIFNAATENIYHPFFNVMVCQLMNWFYSGLNQKSIVELNHLIKEILVHDDFNISDLKGFSVSRELHCLDMMEDKAAVSGEAGWRESSMKICLPVDKQKLKKNTALMFEVPGVWHPDLLKVIHTAFEDTKAQFYYLTLFCLF